MLCGFHPQTTSITGLFNFNEEHIISFCIIPGAYAGLSSPWFFQLLPFALLWHSSRSCHSKPATMFTFSPPVFSNAVLFFFIIVYPPSLSVCLSSSHLFNLPHEPTLSSIPHRPLLPAASRPFPHFARRVPHECQAGIQGVCRRASLAGSAGASAGRTWCLDRVRVTNRNACCDDWLFSPCHFLTGAHCAMLVGGLWRAVTCGMRSSFFLFLSILACHHSQWCWFILPSTVNIVN